MEFRSITKNISVSAHARIAGATLLFLLSIFLMQIGAAYAESNEYRLGHEDVIIVTVMRHDELSGEFFVPTDGLVNIPRIGQISVAGKTISEVTKIILDGVSKFLNEPDVSVKLKTPRPQLVYVTGVVTRPGPYDVKPGWRITETIGAAGGVALGIESADCTVTIAREQTGLKQTMSYPDLLRGDQTKNMLIQAGDQITVSAAETMPIYVTGRVNKPGLYNIRKDSGGILEAITMAGGTLDDAALTKVTVTHLNGESESVSIVPVTMEGKQQGLIKLRTGDLVVVPESSAKFAVLGWVNMPGFFPLPDGQHVTLSSAVSMAKGMDNRRAGISQVAVLRTVNGKQERMVFNLNKFFKKGDLSQNPEIQAGDIIFVPETGKIDWDRTMGLLSGTANLAWVIDRFVP